VEQVLPVGKAGTSGIREVYRESRQEGEYDAIKCVHM
jgi:hypothetical protein